MYFKQAIQHRYKKKRKPPERSKTLKMRRRAKIVFAGKRGKCIVAPTGDCWRCFNERNYILGQRLSKIWNSDTKMCILFHPLLALQLERLSINLPKQAWVTEAASLFENQLQINFRKYNSKRIKQYILSFRQTLFWKALKQLLCEI